MKSIRRRIRRLEEERFGTPADIEFARRLNERINEGRQRLAEARERGELGPTVSWPHVEAVQKLLVEAAVKANRARSGRNRFRGGRRDY